MMKNSAILSSPSPYLMMERVFNRTFIVLAVGFLPFVLCTSALDPGLAPRLTILAALMLVHTVASLIVFKKIDWNIPPAAVFIFCGLAAAIWSSEVAVNRVEALFFCVRGAVLFLFTIHLYSVVCRGSDESGFVANVVAVSSLVQSIAGLLQFFGVVAFSQGWGSVTGTLLNRNLFASYTALSLGFIVVVFLTGGRVSRFFAGAALVAGSTALICAGCRSAWLAVLFAGVVTVGFIAVRRITRRDNHTIARGNIVLFLMLVAAGLCAGIFVKQYDTEDPSVVERAKTLMQPDFASNKQRVILWTKTVRMIQDNWQRGVGAGNWKIVLPKYGTGDLLENNCRLVEVRAYNDFLQIAAETGIAGFIAWTGLFAWAIFGAIRMMLCRVNQQVRRIGMGMFFSLLVFCIVASFDFPLERIEHGILLSLIVILIDAGVNRCYSLSSRSFILSLFMILLLLPIVGYGIVRWKEESAMRCCYVDRSRSDWSGLWQHAHAVDRNFFSLDYAATPVDWYEATALCGLGRYKDAIGQYEDALRAHSWHMLSMNDLASCFALTGQREKALFWYDRALAISPDFSDARKNREAVLSTQSESRTR